MRVLILGALCAALAGCDSGGSSSAGYCVGSFEGGSTAWRCNNCSGLEARDEFEDFRPAIDNRPETFREFHIAPGGGQVTVIARAPEDMSFPDGVDAGALLRFPDGVYSNVGVRFNLYREGVPVDTLTGGEHTVVGNVSGAGTPTYYAVTPSGAFDRMEAVITVSANSEAVPFRVYELCGDR